MGFFNFLKCKPNLTPVVHYNEPIGPTPPPPEYPDEIINVVDVWPWNEDPQRRWGKREITDIDSIVVHQAASSGKLVNVNKYHITPTSDRDGDGEIEAWERNHISSKGAPHICLDDQTEVLTSDGWKLFKDLNRKEKIATLNKKLEFEWEVPVAYIEQDYKGPMVSYKSQKLDFKVTPNHRMLVDVRFCGKHRDNWQAVNAEELINKYSKNKYKLIKAAKSFKGIKKEYIEINEYKIPIETYIKLVGWYLSEGSIKKSLASKTLIVTQTKKTHLPEIFELFKKLSSLTGSKYKYNDNRDFLLCNTKLCNYLIENFGDKCHNKRISKAIKELPSEVLKDFLTTIVKGDGTKHGSGFQYISPSSQLLDDLQEISVKCGFAGKLTWGVASKNNPFNRKLVQGRLGIYPNNTALVREKPVIEDYAGEIYCVQVPNEKIIVRRNGHVLCLYNCYHMCIDYDGTIYQCNSVSSIVWHAGIRYYNDHAIGIMLRGNFNGPTWTPPNHVEIKEPTSEQLDSLKKLLNLLTDDYNIDILGHCEVKESKRDCPGILVMKFITDYRNKG